MIRVLALVLTLLILGNAAATLSGAPVPGAAIGLAMLATLIAYQGGPDPEMEAFFDGVAPNAPLLFVPAAAGAVANLDILALFWVQFVAAVVFGTAATLVLSGLFAQALFRGERQRT